MILNPTGGFKALVPYTVLVGMLKRASCRYIFEQSEALLDLPPLPIQLDRAPFEVFRAVFERIERETTISLKDWESAVPYSDRPTIEPLVEHAGDEITLSSVGLLFLDEMRTPSQFVPFLSQKAWDECLNNLSQVAECEPFRFLERVSKSTQAFGLAEHANSANGMRWLKPGRTKDRYLVSKEGWRLLVWRAIREDEVGKDYPHRIIVNPGTDRGRYVPFTRMEYVL